MGDSIENDVVNGGLQLFTVVEEKSCEVITDVLHQAEDHMTSLQGAKFFLPTIEVDEHSIHKSTLARNLMAISFYSKTNWQELSIAFKSITMVIVSKQNIYVNQVYYLQNPIVGCILSSGDNEVIVNCKFCCQTKKNIRLLLLKMEMLPTYWKDYMLVHGGWVGCRPCGGTMENIWGTKARC